MSAFGRQDAAGGGHGLLVRFFDVLHVDGTDLIDLPLAQRQVKLDALVGDLAVPRVVTADPSEAQALFDDRSEEHTSELQSLMRISYAVFCLKKKRNNKKTSYIKQCNTNN